MPEPDRAEHVPQRTISQVQVLLSVHYQNGKLPPAEKTPQSESRLENLEELQSVAQDFLSEEDNEHTLTDFLEHVALVSDIDDAKLDDDKITLMTLHSAKGLEFPVVFLVGMEEGLFPHARTLMNEEEIEEERRLCYVGITRAE